MTQTYEPYEPQFFIDFTLAYLLWMPLRCAGRNIINTLEPTRRPARYPMAKLKGVESPLGALVPNELFDPAWNISYLSGTNYCDYTAIMKTDCTLFACIPLPLLDSIEDVHRRQTHWAPDGRLRDRLYAYNVAARNFRESARVREGGLLVPLHYTSNLRAFKFRQPKGRPCPCADREFYIKLFQEVS